MWQEEARAFLSELIPVEQLFSQSAASACPGLVGLQANRFHSRSDKARRFVIAIVTVLWRTTDLSVRLSCNYDEIERGPMGIFAIDVEIADPASSITFEPVRRIMIDTGSELT